MSAGNGVDISKADALMVPVFAVSVAAGASINVYQSRPNSTKKVEVQTDSDYRFGRDSQRIKTGTDSDR